VSLAVTDKIWGPRMGGLHTDLYLSAACYRVFRSRQETKSRFAADEGEGRGGGRSQWAWGCRSSGGVSLRRDKAPCWLVYATAFSASDRPRRTRRRAHVTCRRSEAK
jgi:hypothetical protein